MSLTKERLAEIKARAEAATPGPWEGDCESVYPPRTVSSIGICYDFSCKEDENFVAASRTDVPELVAEVERLRAALWEAQEVIESEWSKFTCCDGRINLPGHSDDCPFFPGEKE